MEHRKQPIVYKRMIQIILELTGYPLKHIAQLIHTSLDNIHAIYCHSVWPKDFKSEIQLLKLYQIVVEADLYKKNK